MEEKERGISAHVGMRIKRMRKSRGLTLEELSSLIHKSKATVSKYESGTISLDIETLYEISEVLQVDMGAFLDYKQKKEVENFLPENFYFDKPEIFMYYYDGRSKKIIRSLIVVGNPAAYGEAPLQQPKTVTDFPVTMYQGLPSFDDREKYQHFFTGKMRPYDTITHIILSNRINTTEKMYICILNPMHANSQAMGMMSGIASSPFFAPIGVKVLISKEPLEENEAFKNVLILTKEEARNFRYYNMMIINRPTSLFLEGKGKKSDK